MAWEVRVPLVCLLVRQTIEECKRTNDIVKQIKRYVNLNGHKSKELSLHGVARPINFPDPRHQFPLKSICSWLTCLMIQPLTTLAGVHHKKSQTTSMWTEFCLLRTNWLFMRNNTTLTDFLVFIIGDFLALQYYRTLQNWGNIVKKSTRSNECMLPGAHLVLWNWQNEFHLESMPVLRKQIGKLIIGRLIKWRWFLQK